MNADTPDLEWSYTLMTTWQVENIPSEKCTYYNSSTEHCSLAKHYTAEHVLLSTSPWILSSCLEAVAPCYHQHQQSIFTINE